MKKHKIKVEKSARYFTIGIYGQQVKTVLFVCHGYATLANEFLEEFEGLLKEDIFIVAPEGLHRFYKRGTTDKVAASWMTKEEREDDIHDYVFYLDKVYRETMTKFPKSTSVIVLGFSQGAATVSRWASLGKSRMDNLILWCGFFPPDLTVEGIPENVRLTLVTASDDKWISAEQEIAQVAEMKKIAPDLIHVRFEGKHEINLPALKEIINGR